MYIYPIDVIEDICARCTILPDTTLDMAWSKFFAEVASRFGGDRSYIFVLELFERVSRCYIANDRHKQFLFDILCLPAPKLFSCQDRTMMHHEEVRNTGMTPAKHFTEFLRTFLHKYGLRQSVMSDMQLILVS